MLKLFGVCALISVQLIGCGGGAGPAGASSAQGGLSQSSTLASDPPLASNPMQARRLPDLERIETPVDWDYRAEYPSRAACAESEGLTFEVGPGKAYETPRQVPWIRLLPCDVVKIFHRPNPYRDIVFIGARGEAGKYITIKGVPGIHGEMPVFDASEALSPPDGVGMPQALDGAGMFVMSRPVNIGGGLSSAAYGYKPGFIHLSGLKVVGARMTGRYVSLSGGWASWSAFSAGVYVSPAEHLAITDCELTNSGLGLFVNSNEDYMAPAPSYTGNARQSRSLLIRNNYFHDNGLPGDTSLHNSYTEAIGTVYEYNYFGPSPGTLGDNIKDRSAGIIFRNNYIDGGVHNIALRDPESNGAFEAAQKDAWGEDLVKYAFVYNNQFIQRGASENAGILIGHGDGDYGSQAQYRYGKLFFYQNRVVSLYDYAMYSRDAAPLFEMLNYNRTTEVCALNNMFYAAAATLGATPSSFALFFWGGQAHWPSFVDAQGISRPSNWINRYVETMPNYGNYASSSINPSLYAGARFDGSGHAGLVEQDGAPGFVDFENRNYALSPESAYFSLKAPMPPEVLVRALTASGSPVQATFSAPPLP